MVVYSKLVKITPDTIKAIQDNAPNGGIMLYTALIQRILDKIDYSSNKDVYATCLDSLSDMKEKILCENPIVQNTNLTKSSDLDPSYMQVDHLHQSYNLIPNSEYTSLDKCLNLIQNVDISRNKNKNT